MRLIELHVNERRAFKKITELGVSQFRYNNNYSGYACRFSDISSIISEQNSKLDTEDNYYSDGYRHHLICYKDSSHRVENFAIWLIPYCVNRCGDIAYCLSSNGEVRSIVRSELSHWWYACWNEGALVATISK